MTNQKISLFSDMISLPYPKKIQFFNPNKPNIMVLINLFNTSIAIHNISCGNNICNLIIVQLISHKSIKEI